MFVYLIKKSSGIYKSNSEAGDLLEKWIEFFLSLPKIIITVFILLFIFFRWKYGFRINAPSTRRSWNMAEAQRGSTSTAPAPSPPAPRPYPSSGRSPWRPKEPRCTRTITWTALATGTRTTTTILTRTPCRGRSWCEVNRRLELICPEDELCGCSCACDLTSGFFFAAKFKVTQQKSTSICFQASSCTASRP